MKIPGTSQVKAWDQYSISHEPVASIDLMERAAGKCFAWLQERGTLSRPIFIFCGKGNNGGDGLALARMLAEKGADVSVYILEFGHKGTADFQTNLERLHHIPASGIYFLQDKNNFPSIAGGTLLIDALFGTGLSHPLDGLSASLVDHINNSGCEIISIDMPSGLFADHSSVGNTIIKARHTLSFQCYKLAFLVAENAAYTGQVHILDIGLHPAFGADLETKYEWVDEQLIHSIYHHRNPFAHKGNFGHALLVAGSYGKMGAAVLSSNACLRSGTGLVTSYMPKCGYEIMQNAVPEAMVMTDPNRDFITKWKGAISSFDAMGIGPGIGTAPETRKLVKELIILFKKPIVLDADALNGLAKGKKPPPLPSGSILTPHPKEFERLFGHCDHDFERLDKAMQQAASMGCFIVLKGHHTFIATPGGKGYFNSTGNAGMATAGSGDVLTGMLTGFLAQGYGPEEAAILAVYLHGLAGDLAANECSQEAMLAGDITRFLGMAFIKIST